MLATTTSGFIPPSAATQHECLPPDTCPLTPDTYPQPAQSTPPTRAAVFAGVLLPWESSPLLGGAKFWQRTKRPLFLS